MGGFFALNQELVLRDYVWGTRLTISCGLNSGSGCWLLGTPSIVAFWLNELLRPEPYQPYTGGLLTAKSE